jgi:two-component system cell cycle response regulator
MTAAAVLIVEDNPQNLELMRYLLAARGYAVTTVMDGMEATAALERSRPDLVICDIQMPAMDGYGLLGWLRGREALRDVPILAVTALAMVGDRERILAAGFDGYLSKPIVPETFATQISEFLERRRQASLGDAGLPLVLIVDNMQPNLDLADIVLGHMGYRTRLAKGMGQALRLLGEFRPALILSDVCMEDGSGFQLLEAVRNSAELREIPFILITSTADNATDKSRGLALGADRYLFRPIEPSVLKAEIAACLAARGAQR